MEMWFYRRIIRIQSTQHISTNEVLRTMETKRVILIIIRNRQFTIMVYYEERGNEARLK